MPYVNRSPLRIVRRPGMRGLGDTFNYAGGTFSVTFIDQNGNTLPWASLSAVEQSQALSACVATQIFGQPSGSSLIINVNGNGSANDVPAYTGSLAYSPAVPLNSLSMPGRGPLSGPELARASNVLNGLNNAGQTPAQVAAGPQSGGVATASLPANFQATASQIAAAAASYQQQNPSNDSSNSNNSVNSTSIPSWVWIAAAALVVALLWSQNAKGQ